MGNWQSGAISDTVAPGSSISYESGPTASGPHAVSNSLIFEDDDSANEGAWVKIVPEGVRAEVFTDNELKASTTLVFCDQRTRAFKVGTDTFQLTLYGTAPRKQSFGAKRSFSGRYGQYSPATAVCQDPKAEIPAEKPVPACRGGGGVHSVTVPRITEPPYRGRGIQWVRSSYVTCRVPVWRDLDCKPRNQIFRQSKLSADLHATYRVWYDFNTGSGGVGSHPSNAVPDQSQDDPQTHPQDDQQSETPEVMPDTGAGGLAAGATISVDNVVTGLTMLAGASSVVLRQR